MQTGGHDQVDVATEHLLEPVAEADVPDEPGHLVEFHEQVHVSFRPGIPPCNRAEQVERSHAERAQFFGVRGQPCKPGAPRGECA